MQSKNIVVHREAQLATPDLAALINEPRHCGTGLYFWWLGQAGFALRYGDTLLLIDPYLSDSLAAKYRGTQHAHERLMPIPVAPEALRGCDWYLCTHGHTDHMDPATICSVLSDGRPSFLVPRAEIGRAGERGIPPSQLHTINAGEVCALTSTIHVEAIAAAHENRETDCDGNQRYLGYILSFPGLRLYHSGDCVPYAGLAEALSARQIDLALLPINGRDSYRTANGIPGNFSLQEAIALCQTARIPYLVGHHFEMFRFNTVDRQVAAAILEREAGVLGWLLPHIGASYCIREQ